jgi:hypothetical protein
VGDPMTPSMGDGVPLSSRESKRQHDRPDQPIGAREK